MDLDLSLLQDFEITCNSQWSDWSFKNQQYENVPLTFFNRFNKNQIKCCDLSQATSSNKGEEDFVVVVGNTKVKNSGYISSKITMGQKRKDTKASTRTFTKKQRRNLRTWNNQHKTKFKEITVKSDWKLIKAINKRDLTEHIPIVKNLKIQHLKKIGKLHLINPAVQKINWNPMGIKEHVEYQLTSTSTANESFFRNKAAQLMDSQTKKKSLICSLQFLLALLTVRGGQYPWNLSIEKQGNLIIFENYNGEDGEKNMTYLDMFTVNENTSNNMPDETRIRQHCKIASKYSKVFKDLLASGDVYENQDEEIQSEKKEEKEEEEEEGEEEDEDEEEENLEHVRKYVKIELDDIDIYTYTNVNGAKRKSEEQIEECLIRAFVETGSDGAWIEDMKKSQGTLVFQEYQANSCSLQKWICEGRIAGVQLIKMGFIGFSKKEPKLINVKQSTLESLEKHINFKATECWPVLKYLLNNLYSQQDGTYVMSRSSYNTPLSLKIFKIPVKEQEQEQQTN